MSSLDVFKNKYKGLESREQKSLIAGIVFVLFFILNTVIYKPMTSSIEQLKKSNADNSKLLVWMAQSANQIKNSAGSIKSNSNGAGRSLNEIINSTASKKAITISRSRPRNNNQYQIWMDKVSFNDLLGWLNTLQNDYAVYVTSINLASSEQGGIVRVNLTFQGSDS